MLTIKEALEHAFEKLIPLFGRGPYLNNSSVRLLVLPVSICLASVSGAWFRLISDLQSLILVTGVEAMPLCTGNADNRRYGAWDTGGLIALMRLPVFCHSPALVLLGIVQPDMQKAEA